jgi:hypothetical protein
VNATEPADTQHAPQAPGEPATAGLTVAEAMARVRALRAQLRALQAAKRAQERHGRDARLLEQLERHSTRNRASQPEEPRP